MTKGFYSGGKVRRGRVKLLAQAYTEIAIRRILATKTVSSTGCWIPKTKPGKNGYVYLKMRKMDFEKRKGELCHRFVYEQLRGPIPAGLELDHLCRNPPCCNPDHLEPVTHSVNMTRGNHPALNRAHFEAMATCYKGHPRFGPDADIWVSKTGARKCRECMRQNKRKIRARKTEKVVTA